MTQELIHLNWSKFEVAALNTFRNLLNCEDFADVTLACADGQKVVAHKVLLSSCSPLFKDILLGNNHSHPIIYLKGIKFIHLKSLLKFIYSGEVNIKNESLAEFLETADELQIAGLTKAVEPEHQDFIEKSPLNQEDQAELQMTSLKMGQHENTIRSHLKELKALQDKYDNTNLHCDYCSFVTLIEDSLSDHIKEQHRDMYSEFEIEGIVGTNKIKDIHDKSLILEGHFCDRCDVKETSGRALLKHRQEEHPGMSYYCKVCSKEFTRFHKLKEHRLAIHDEVKFPCTSCDRSFTNKSNLAIHRKKVIH